MSRIDRQPTRSKHQAALHLWGAVFLLGLLWTCLIANTAMAGPNQPANVSGPIVVVGPKSGPAALLIEAVYRAAMHALKGCAATQAETQHCPKQIIRIAEACSAGNTATGPRQTISARIIALNPSLVFGHPCDRAALRAADAYAAANIPFIAIGARHPDLSDTTRFPTTIQLAPVRGSDAAAMILATKDPHHTPAALCPASGALVIVHDRTRRMRRLAVALQYQINLWLEQNAPQCPSANAIQAKMEFATPLTSTDAVKTILHAPTPETRLTVFAALYPADARVLIHALDTPDGPPHTVIGPTEWTADAPLANEFRVSRLNIRAVKPRFTNSSVDNIEDSHVAKTVAATIDALVAQSAAHLKEIAPPQRDQRVTTWGDNRKAEEKNNKRRFVIPQDQRWQVLSPTKTGTWGQ